MPTITMVTEILLSILYACLFLWVTGRSSFFRDQYLSNRHFQALFILKLLAAVGLYLIYTRFYPDRRYADIFRYYDDSRFLFNSIHDKPYDFFRMMTGYDSSSAELWTYYNDMHNWFNSELIFNDARTMIRLNTLFRFISYGHYFPIAIIFCFMGFIGLTALYKVITSEFGANNILIAAGIFLMPGLLLWTSGVIKEAFLIFTLGIVMYQFSKVIHKQASLKNYILMLVAFFFLLNIKAYMTFVILPGMVAWLITSRVQKSRAATALKPSTYLPLASVYLAVFSGYLFLIYNFAEVIAHAPVAELLHNKQVEFTNLAITEKAGSLVEIPHLDNTNGSLLRNAPHAFIYTLTRPFFLESKNPMMLAAGAENLLILLLIVVNLIFLFRKDDKYYNYSFILFCKFTVAALFILIGLVTPVLGAVVRYKVAALPFLIAALLSSSKWEKFNQKLSVILKR